MFVFLKLKADVNVLGEHSKSKKLPLYVDTPTTKDGISFVYPEDVEHLPPGSKEQPRPKLKQFNFEEVKKLVKSNYSFYVLADRAYKDYVKVRREP